MLTQDAENSGDLQEYGDRQHPGDGEIQQCPGRSSHKQRATPDDDANEIVGPVAGEEASLDPAPEKARVKGRGDEVDHNATPELALRQSRLQAAHAEHEVSK